MRFLTFSLLFVLPLLAACADPEAPASDAGHKLGAGGVSYVVQGSSPWVTAPDTPAADLNNSIAHFTVATGAGVIKTSSGTFIAANVCNEGTSTAWFQVYFGQTAPDAGGTNDAGTAPSIVPLRIPAGACASLDEVQVMPDGGVWYSSSTQGLLTVDAGVQNMAADIVYR